MPDGGCFCSRVRIQYTGDIAIKAVCHCTDCRKISGSTYSTNIAVPESGFQILSGTPKTISKTADGGNTITSHFCGDCGTTLFSDGKTYDGLKIVKAGVMDDVAALGDAKPQVELYAPKRVPWVAEVQGAEQKQAMA